MANQNRKLKTILPVAGIFDQSKEANNHGAEHSSEKMDIEIENEHASDEHMEEEQDDNKSEPSTKSITDSANKQAADQNPSNGLIIGTSADADELAKLPGFNFGSLLSTEPKTDLVQSTFNKESAMTNEEEYIKEPKAFEVSDQ